MSTTYKERGVSIALWRAYRIERAKGHADRQAAGNALTAAGIDTVAERERLRAALLVREREQGLSVTEETQERELELESVEAEAIERSRVAGSPIAAIGRDAQQRVNDLEAQRARLAPEALTDGAVKGELANIESELVEARQAVELVGVAEGELKRREDQVVQDAAQQERERVLARVRELHVERLKVVAKLDRSAAAYANALGEYQALAGEQAALMNTVFGGYSLGLQRMRVRGALEHFLHEAKVPPNVLGLDYGALETRVPLRDVEPAEVA